MAGKDHAHDLVTEVGGRLVHQRAPTIDHGDAVLPPVISGGRRDTAGTGAAMHPDMPDAELRALTHRVLRLVGCRGDDDGVNAPGDALQVVVAHGTLDLVGI